MRLRSRLKRVFLRRFAAWLGDKRALYLFRQLGHRFRVEEAISRGIQGRLDDEVVFGRYLRTGTWSPQITDFLVRCFADERTGTFIDVGANLGLVTLAVARLGHVDCKCFEPEPANLALLRANAERSGAGDRIEIFPFALYREEAQLELELSERNRGDHRIRVGTVRDGPEAARQVISIPARPLDAVLDATALRRPLVVKCDAQGAEAHIWAGGEKTLALADALVLEFWPYALARVGSRPEELIERLCATYQRGWVLHKREPFLAAAAAPIAAVAEALHRACRTAHPRWQADVIAVKDDWLAR